MNKLIFFTLLSLVIMNCLHADEYISDEYFESVVAQTEVVSDPIDSLPITQTIEEQEREENKKIFEEESIAPIVIEEKENIQALSYETVLAQAKREDKVIMLSIRSTDCKYCDRMEEKTLSDESVKDALEANFISIHYNQDLESLPLGLQNAATPMFIFVNSNEDILNMYPGMRSPDEFKEVLEQILSM